MGGARALVARCPDWPVVAAGYPAGVPAAVVFANRVVACSVAARDDGVAVGLRRREAQGRCPELVVVEQDLGRDARAFEAVAAAVEAFTPRVEVGGPGVVSFETRGPSRYFGGDRALAAKVAAAVDAVVASLGAPLCQVGVADGPFAADLAAMAARPAAVGARAVLAATLVVPPGASAEFLAPLSVWALQRPDLCDLLTRLGIKTLGDLAAVPAETVLARFGADGAVAHRLARGLDERPLAARTPPLELTVAAELDPPAERVDMAMFVAKTLADELHESLAARGLACTRIAIEAETEHGEQVTRLWRHDGALSSRAIAEQVRWQLDGWLSTGQTTAGVTLIRLIPDEVKADHGRQLGFWGGSAEANDRASRGFARIQGMLGPEAVVTAVVGGGRDPAGQVSLIPWGDPRPGGIPIAGARAGQPAPRETGAARGTGQQAGGAGGAGRQAGSTRGGGRARATAAPAPARAPGAAAGTRPGAPPEGAPWPGHLPLPAPAVVYPEPVPAGLYDCDGEAVSVSGRGMLGEVPATLAIAGGPPVPVVAWAGPWPAEERWWDQQSSRRRARFQVCLADSAAHVVVLENGQWWVEATYD